MIVDDARLNGEAETTSLSHVIEIASKATAGFKIPGTCRLLHHTLYSGVAKMGLDLADIKALSNDQILVIASETTAESSLDSLHDLAAARIDALPPELLLRILLTHLPESVEPVRYTSLISAIVNGNLGAPPATIDVRHDKSTVLSRGRAKRVAKSIVLLPLRHELFAYDDELGPLEHFVIHRAHRVEEETGLGAVPELVTPFLPEYPRLRHWFISSVLPLLRLHYEYYPGTTDPVGLAQIETTDAKTGIGIWLAGAKAARENGKENMDGSTLSLLSKSKKEQSENHLARDLKGLVAPWMLGAHDRAKRRATVMANSQDKALQAATAELEEGPFDGWHHVYTYLLTISRDDLSTVADIFDTWNGPRDVDLGDYGDDSITPSTKEQETLDSRWRQAIIATIFACERSGMETFNAASRFTHKATTSSAGLDESLDGANLSETLSTLVCKVPPTFVPNSLFSLDSLLNPENPLTASTSESSEAVNVYIVSGMIFWTLGEPLTVAQCARIRANFAIDEQRQMLVRLLHHMAQKEKSADGWRVARNYILWLWSWGNDLYGETPGNGLFWRLDGESLDTEILKAMLTAGVHDLVTQLYINTPTTFLSPTAVESTILSTALGFFDSATSGNRTRGPMKHASDITTTFSKQYPNSTAFRRTESLISAAHSMSRYTLTLTHNAPFAPVNLRASPDPLAFIERILAQNRGTYPDLPHLTSIARNLVAAGLPTPKDGSPSPELSKKALEAKQRDAERRIVAMAVEAALNEDDGETAYSYVVSRLNTAELVASSSPARSGGDQDDIPWRAALAAGRHKSHPSTPAQQLRLLEQRMDLLAQALLLAPAQHLPEVLSVWRKCEEELSALLAQIAVDEDAAEGVGLVGDVEGDKMIPGAFDDALLVQPRREVGRGANEESPMGLFDVARGAASAFSKTAFPLRGSALPSARSSGHVRNASAAGSDASTEDGKRVRRRDMVANAVTGGLASGIGWVLGAKPVRDSGHQVE